MFPAKLKSRKLGVAVGSILTIILNNVLGLDMDSNTIMSIAGVASSFIVGQGIVDAKKG